eukprot:7400485-Pyramimonas_sp.AAC.1
MYAYSLAAAITNIPHKVEKRLDSVLIAQPPADDQLVRESTPADPQSPHPQTRRVHTRRVHPQTRRVHP